MLQPINVLLVEDNRIDARRTELWLRSSQAGAFDVECVEQLTHGIDRVAKGGIDLVVLDLNLPDSRGIETFIKLHGQSPDVPIVVLTGEYDHEIGPTAVENGAQDYLVKQHADEASLPHAVRYAFTRHKAQTERLKQARVGESAPVIRFSGAKGQMAAKILIVEDHPENQKLMVYLLSHFGYQVQTARTGEEAIEMSLSQNFDLIICDIQLPGIDGCEMARRLRANSDWSKAPLIAVTALAMVGDRDKVLAAGFEGYLSKPIAPRTFLEQIQSFLADHQVS